MIVKQNLNLEEQRQIAKDNNYHYRSHQTFLVAADCLESVIVSKEGAAIIKLEDLPALIRSLKEVAIEAIEEAQNASMSEKNRVAKENGKTYGEFSTGLAMIKENLK